MKRLNKCIAALLLGGLCASAHAGKFALNNVLSGGYYDGKWLSTSQLHGQYWLWGGEDLEFWGPNGKHGDGCATAIEQDHPDEEHPGHKSVIDAPTFMIQTVNQQSYAYPSHLLSVLNPQWNVMPRRAASMPANNSQYKALVADFLAGRGLPSDGVKLTRIDRIDLDGNGTDEVVIVGSAHGGKVPFALLRQIQVQYVATSVLSEPEHGKVEDIYYADLSGDGRMEVIIGSKTAKKYRQAVYTIKSGDTDRVIENIWRFN